MYASTSRWLQRRAVPDRHVHHGVAIAERARGQPAAAELRNVDGITRCEQHANGRVSRLRRGEIRQAADEHGHRPSHRLGGSRKVAEHLIHGRSGGGPPCSASAPRVPSHDSSPVRRARPYSPVRRVKRAKAVERAERAGSRQHAAQREGLRPGIALLGVQLLTCTADDVPGRNPRRAGGDAVVAGQAGGERPVRDVASSRRPSIASRISAMRPRAVSHSTGLTTYAGHVA